MKFPCCLIIIVLMLISVSLQYQTWQILKNPKPTPSSLTSITPPQPSVINSPLPSSTPTPIPNNSEAQLLFRVDNPSACSFTDTSKFTLKEDHDITKLQTWYSWNSNEISLDYNVKKDGQTIYEGVLTRKDCDPYQRQWCQAVDESINRKFIKGDYSLVADTAKICQNTLSEGNGFIFVYGK